MRGSLQLGAAIVATCALVAMSATSANAGTIIKLSLGDDSSAFDIEFDGTTLSTVSDGGAGTGDQQTNAEFLDFISEPDITDGLGSFTLDGLTVSGGATNFGGFLVIQEFSGGTFTLYDNDGANTVLLTGTLDDSTLTGPIGPPATGALFTTSFGNVTGGALASVIDADSLTLAITFTNINGGAGLGISGAPGSETLNAFDADASVIVAADPVPEPATIALAALGTLAAAGLVRRRST